MLVLVLMLMSKCEPSHECVLVYTAQVKKCTHGSLVHAYMEAYCSGIVGILVFTYNTILVPGVSFLL